MGYVAAGYVVTLVGVVGYTWRTLRRGRQLTRSLPPREVPWR
jgi:hypothetical protein